MYQLKSLSSLLLVLFSSFFLTNHVKSSTACPYLGLNKRNNNNNNNGKTPTTTLQSSSLRKETSSTKEVEDCQEANQKVHSSKKQLRLHRYLQEGTFDGTPDQAIEDAKDWIADLIDDDNEMGPKFVRLGFHDCVGGCNGCVNLDTPDNAGLDVPIDELEPLTEFYASQLSVADIWALAAVHAADLARQGAGPSIPFTWYGRADCGDPNHQGPDVPMPSAHLTNSELLEFFASNFDFSAHETVAIMGAHTLGELSGDNSGFDAPQGWVPNELRLDNRFYTLLLPNGDDPNPRYQQEEHDNGQFLWRLAPNNNGGGGRFVMLNADMALILDLTGEIDSATGEVDCDVDECETAPTLNIARDYADSQALWLSDFRDVMVRMVVNGNNPCNLTAVDGADVDDLLEDCSKAPTSSPTERPTDSPSGLPTATPSNGPTASPTMQPTPLPTPEPTPLPTTQPTPQPTPNPTPQPSRQPTPQPTPNPTPQPSPPPSPQPALQPTLLPSPQPNPLPSPQPTPKPSFVAELTPAPMTPAPSPKPSQAPVTTEPTPLPTQQPVRAPISLAPMETAQTADPTAAPVLTTTTIPSASPVSLQPALTPTTTREPTSTAAPSKTPTTSAPSMEPVTTEAPILDPTPSTSQPTAMTGNVTTLVPSELPTPAPVAGAGTSEPTAQPSSQPTSNSATLSFGFSMVALWIGTLVLV